jgi:hypothetical protein
MKKRNYIISLAVIILFITAAAFIKKQADPWRQDQLMAPEDLATVINNPTDVKPLIISVGPAGLIKGSVEAGPANEKENLDKLSSLLSKEDKSRDIVIYCGCCPFKDCPNIRPAFSLLTSMKFTHYKLLNLSHNLRVDWIAHGYPMTETK